MTADPPRHYDANGYRETPFAVERRYPSGLTRQAYSRDDKAALYELLADLDDVPGCGE